MYNLKSIILKNTEFDQLIQKYIRGDLDVAQTKVLEAWLSEVAQHSEENLWSDGEVKTLYHQMTLNKNQKSPVRWGYWVAAAVVLLVGFFLTNKYVENSTQEVEISASEILPAQDSILLTLENGQQIYIHSQAESIQLTGGSIRDSEGHLLRNSTDKLEMLQLQIPKGRQFQVTLDDGTKVWLNAGAKMRYPSKFVAEKREVELAGEAYFEVAKQMIVSADGKSHRKPFIVRSSNQRVSVLGTHFNIDANDDAGFSQSTLVEGSVQVTNLLNESRTLKPGEQSIVSKKSNIKVQPVDIDAVLGWKNNLFVFHNSNLREIMKDVERWYDIKIEINQWPAERFYGEIQRNAPLSEVLKMIELSSNYKFKVVSDGSERRLLME